MIICCSSKNVQFQSGYKHNTECKEIYPGDEKNYLANQFDQGDPQTTVLYSTLFRWNKDNTNLGKPSAMKNKAELAESLVAICLGSHSSFASYQKIWDELLNLSMPQFLHLQTEIIIVPTSQVAVRVKRVNTSKVQEESLAHTMNSVSVSYYHLQIGGSPYFTGWKNQKGTFIKSSSTVLSTQ